MFCSPFEVTAGGPGEVRLRHAPAATADCLLPIGRVALAQLQHTDRHCMGRHGAGRRDGQNRQVASKNLPGGRTRSRVSPGGGELQAAGELGVPV